MTLKYHTDMHRGNNTTDLRSVMRPSASALATVDFNILIYQSPQDICQSFDDIKQDNNCKD